MARWDIMRLVLPACGTLACMLRDPSTLGRAKGCACSGVSSLDTALCATCTPRTTPDIRECVLLQAALYQACVDAGITLLSIGHRPAIKAFHQAVIHFQVRTLLSAVPVVWPSRA
jgi:hypothetical protein